MANIVTENFYRYFTMICRNMLATTFNHRLRIIDANNFYVWLMNISTCRKCGGTSRATKIINMTISRDETFCQHTDCSNNVGIARHGALNHVWKDFGNVFIKGKIAEFFNRRGKNSIFHDLHCVGDVFFNFPHPTD